MKSILFLPCLLFLFVEPPLSAAAERFRTDINPALLYWQAFGEWPSLSEEDSAYVRTNDWRSRQPDERFGQLMAQYDNSFKLLRRAAKAKVPCDWGYDLTDGPEALLPGLAKAKAAAQTARLRVHWHFQRGDQAAARDDLAAAFVLGRNVSKDRILISALVQFAIENIITAAVAENFYRFTPETLRQLLAEIDASPTRGTIAQCIAFERYSFRDWLVRNVREIQKSSPSEEKAMTQIRELIRRFLSAGENPDFTQIEKVVKAAGSTPEGVIAYVKGVDALYDEADVLMTRPYPEFQTRIKAFNERVANHPNLFVHMFFPIFENCRNKEFAAEVSIAMLRAGTEYRLAGEAGLKRVGDPVLKEPFAFRRFQFAGEDRGFELRSKFHGRGFEEALIFVEKGGPSFQVSAKNVGKPVL